jgi:hypothetical protein
MGFSRIFPVNTLNYRHVTIRDKEKHWSARMRSLHYRRAISEQFPLSVQPWLGMLINL